LHESHEWVHFSPPHVINESALIMNPLRQSVGDFVTIGLTSTMIRVQGSLLFRA
jgi:hypothetical protein